MLALKHRPLDLEGLDLEPLGEGRCLAVMDGECAVCSWGARTLARHDRADRIRITTIQSSLGRALCERAGLSPDDPDSWLVIEAGQAYTHASAVLRLSRHLSGPWSVLGRCARIIPLPVLDWFYLRLARNRLALFGRGDICALPDERVKARLIG